MAVFPQDKIQSITGVKTNYAYLDVESVLEPIKAFLPVEEKVETVETSPGQTEAPPTDFVKERMEEIAAAIDNENEKEQENTKEDVAPLTEALEKVDISDDKTESEQY